MNLCKKSKKVQSDNLTGTNFQLENGFYNHFNIQKIIAYYYRKIQSQQQNSGPSGSFEMRQKYNALAHLTFNFSRNIIQAKENEFVYRTKTQIENLIKLRKLNKLRKTSSTKKMFQNGNVQRFINILVHRIQCFDAFLRMFYQYCPGQQSIQKRLRCMKHYLYNFVQQILRLSQQLEYHRTSQSKSQKDLRVYQKEMLSLKEKLQNMFFLQKKTEKQQNVNNINVNINNTDNSCQQRFSSFYQEQKSIKRPSQLFKNQNNISQVTQTNCFLQRTAKTKTQSKTKIQNKDREMLNQSFLPASTLMVVQQQKQNENISPNTTNNIQKYQNLIKSIKKEYIKIHNQQCKAKQKKKTDEKVITSNSLSFSVLQKRLTKPQQKLSKYSKALDYFAGVAKLNGKQRKMFLKSAKAKERYSYEAFQNNQRSSFIRNSVNFPDNCTKQQHLKKRSSHLRKFNKSFIHRTKAGQCELQQKQKRQPTSFKRSLSTTYTQETQKAPKVARFQQKNHEVDIPVMTNIKTQEDKSIQQSQAQQQQIGSQSSPYTLRILKTQNCGKQLKKSFRYFSPSRNKQIIQKTIKQQISFNQTYSSSYPIQEEQQEEQNQKLFNFDQKSRLAKQRRKGFSKKRIEQKENQSQEEQLQKNQTIPLPKQPQYQEKEYNTTNKNNTQFKSSKHVPRNKVSKIGRIKLNNFYQNKYSPSSAQNDQSCQDIFGKKKFIDSEFQEKKKHANRRKTIINNQFKVTLQDRMILSKSFRNQLKKDGESQPQQSVFEKMKLKYDVQLSNRKKADQNIRRALTQPQEGLGYIDQTYSKPVQRILQSWVLSRKRNRMSYLDYDVQKELMKTLQDKQIASRFSMSQLGQKSLFMEQNQ